MDTNGDQLIGMQLGSCILERRIGTGGMGMVYQARQQRPSREVAIKILNADGESVSFTQQREFLARFKREADIIAQLDHINILPIHEYGEDNEMAYLVMPYLSGGSLSDLMGKQKTVTPEVALPYIEQAAAALQYAHDHHIVHRDIKPANMLFHADGRLMLVDFGIARIIQDPNKPTDDISLTKTGYFMGSADYMAPEMVEGKKVDHHADIYELGVVLFQMLCGRLPFQGATAFTIAAKHLHETPPFLFEVNANISAEIDIVVQKALAKNPEDRYPSITAFATAFREAVEAGQKPSRISDYNTVPEIATSHAPEPTTNNSYNSHAQQTPQPGNYKILESDTLLRPQQTMTPIYEQQPIARQTDNYLTSTPAIQTSKMLEHSQSHHERSNWLLVTTIFVVLLLILAGGTYLFIPQLLPDLTHRAEAINQTPTPFTPATTSTIQPTQTPVSLSTQADNTIQRYFDYINSQNYMQAYNLWDDNYHSNQSYEAFKAGYNDTIKDTLTITNTDQLSPTTFRVDVSIAADQNDNGTPVTTQYEGYYALTRLSDGTWEINQNGSKITQNS